MTRKVFTKLLGLFVLLLAFNTIVMEIVFHRLAARSAGETLQRLGWEALWAGLIALLVALPLAAWISIQIMNRLQQVVAFARRIADGDLKARLDAPGADELAEMESALNQTAERLGQSFAEVESGRQELAAMLDSMQEAVVAVTAEGQVRWSNTVMQRMAGTQIQAGRPLAHSVRDPDLLACVKGALEKRAVQTGRASGLASGRVFEVNATPLPRGGALAVLHDVTRIEAAERTRRDFIANVSHELRTPLTSIQGYVETLLEEPAPNADTGREFLGIIRKSARRMNRLTEDLLALASLESPDYKLALQPMRASALLEDAVMSLGGIASDAGLELETDGAPDAQVMADADALNQVFGNLVENAIKYGRSGGRLCLGAKLLDDEVEFRVQDFGPGLASEHLERIFERFYRVDKARSRESGGTGLGLAIVRHIVQAHGGRVRAESELGAGATFFFTLPVTKSAEAMSTRAH
ncbi:MAG TPA: ATP-binding protein [Terracidiphilus sp.]|nr:ATP-binding protein [Terracidiphilus sp.]